IPKAVDIHDVLPIDPRDDVPPGHNAFRGDLGSFQPGSCGCAVGQDFFQEHSLPDPPAPGVVVVPDFHTKPDAAHLSVPNDLLNVTADGVDGEREANARADPAGAQDGRVHADELAARVEE